MAVSVGRLQLPLTGIIEADHDEQQRPATLYRNASPTGRIRVNYVDVMEIVSPDWNHLNVRGCNRP